MKSTSTMLICSLLLASLSFGEGFVLLDRHQSCFKQPLMMSKEKSSADYLCNYDLSRRRLLSGCLIPLLFFPAENAISAEFTEVNLDCLKDLPAVPSDSVRLFLCRHGQTENNRLRKVQGARVDPPVNINGQVQAENAGKALRNASPCPQTFFSSDLARARMTAEIASSEIYPNIKKPTALNVLREVDFGPGAEGQPVALAKAGMEATYARWAIGNVDYRPSSGGESGREVLQRAAESLKVLSKEATLSSNGCVAAVAHSTFLRILIAMVLDEPLIEAANRKVDNGGITVIDIPKSFKTRSLGSHSKLLGGIVSQTPSDFELDIPICKAIRINESRHLPVIPIGELLDVERRI